MNTKLNYNLSELARWKIGKGNTSNRRIERLRYFVKLKFELQGIDVVTVAVIDTGAVKTVIREDDILRSARGNKLVQSIRNDTAFGIGGSVPTKIYIAEQFELTGEITLPRVEVAVSNSINMSVLGMDILGLFSFKYDLGVGNMIGKFFIFDYQKQLERIEKLCKNNNALGINMIMLLDDEMSKESKVNQSIKHHGIVNIVGTIIDSKGRTVGYKLRNNRGKVINVEKSQVITEAQKRNIGNATVVKLGNGQLILRGKGCKLSELRKYKAETIG